MAFADDSLRRLAPLAGNYKSNFSGTQEIIMAWTTPAATDLRFGFEITMYIANR